MKVYELSYVSYGYGSGICIVAANTPEEALGVANRGGFSFENPSEITSLTSSWEKPGVISESVYQE